MMWLCCGNRKGNVGNHTCSQLQSKNNSTIHMLVVIRLLVQSYVLMAICITYFLHWAFIAAAHESESIPHPSTIRNPYIFHVPAGLPMTTWIHHAAYGVVLQITKTLIAVIHTSLVSMALTKPSTEPTSIRSEWWGRPRGPGHSMERTCASGYGPTHLQSYTSLYQWPSTNPNRVLSDIWNIRCNSSMRKCSGTTLDHSHSPLMPITCTSIFSNPSSSTTGAGPCIGPLLGDQSANRRPLPLPFGKGGGGVPFPSGSSPLIF